MGIFSRNFNKPGPGVPKDMPRKKGAARFFELLARDLGDLAKLNLLFCIVALPSVLAYLMGMLPYIMGFYEINTIFLLLSLIFAFPIGGAIVAYVYYITKMMRDDPSYVWYEFKRKFKENFRQAAPAGVLCTAFIYLQGFMWLQVYFEMVEGVYEGGIIWIVLALLAMLLFSMITPYIFLHYAYIDLKSFLTIKNSMLMTFAYLPRSFMGAVTGGIIWIIFALFLPNSLMVFPLVVVLLISVSWLLTLSWIWPPFDKHFKIEETLVQRVQDEMEQV